MSRNKKLDKFLEKEEFDGFLMFDSSENSNMYYLTGFEAADPFTYLRTDEKSTIVVPQLEYSRAKEEANVDKVTSSSEFIEGESRGSSDTNTDLVAELLEKYDIEELAVPSDFSFGFAEKLREKGVSIEPTENIIEKARQLKSREEIQKIREAQKVTEAAMKKTERILQKAEIQDGELYLDNEPLTSERVRRKLKIFLMEHNCSIPEEPIVACGPESAKPHSTGKGVLKAGESIIVDIFPKHNNNYFGDMTRTFVKGNSNKEVREMKEAVLEAQKAALEVLERGAGVKASEVHDAVCNVLEDHSYQTIRNGAAEKGFIHSTGHAVGLELHESPRVAENEDELNAGMILTIEPGLYDPEIGGVRIEDMVLLKENGYENFNSMHKELEID